VPPVGLTTDRLVSSGGIVSHSSPTKPGSAVAVNTSTNDTNRAATGRTEMYLALYTILLYRFEFLIVVFLYIIYLSVWGGMWDTESN